MSDEWIDSDWDTSWRRNKDSEKIQRVDGLRMTLWLEVPRDEFLGVLKVLAASKRCAFFLL